MQQAHTLMRKKVKLAGKGQITIPKRIRDEDQLQKNDTFVITHTFSGDIVLHKVTTKKPEDAMLEALQNIPPIDADEAWKEVLEERKKGHR